MAVCLLSFLAVGLSMLAVLASASFNYSDPGMWGADFPTCDGASQSPLSIETPSVRQVSGFPFELGSGCTIPAGQAYYVEYTDGGMAMMWNHSSCTLAQPNGVSLQLGRISFHIRGEHVIDGTFTALEMQMQFYSLALPLTSITVDTTPSDIVAAGFSTESSLSVGGDLEALVNGVFDGTLPGFVNVTSTTNATSSNTTSTSTNASSSNVTVSNTTVSSRMFQGRDVVFVSVVARSATVTLNLTVLSFTPYYHYVGSITAPPCTEGVRWYVLATTYKASRLSVEAYSTALVSAGDVGGMNSRPVQGTSEGRSVLYFTGSYPTSGGVSRCVAWSAGILLAAAFTLL